MFRLFFGTALLVVSLPAAAQSEPDGQHSKQVQPKGSDLMACPDLRRIDYEAASKEAAAHPVSSDAEDLAAHARIRGPIPYPETEDSTLILSAIGAPSITQDQPTYTSSVLWRDSAGSWLLDRVDFIDPMDITVPPDPIFKGCPVLLKPFNMGSFEKALNELEEIAQR